MIEQLHTVSLFVGIPGGPEMLIVLLLVVILFGANKLPKLARASGQSIGEFQKGRTEIENELTDMDTLSTEDDDLEPDMETTIADDEQMGTESETERVA